jgi:hypothetical protein
MHSIHSLLIHSFTSFKRRKRPGNCKKVYLDLTNPRKNPFFSFPENPRVVLASASENQNGYSLAIFQDYIYAAFVQSKNIVRVNKRSGKNGTNYFSTRTPGRGPISVLAYDKSKQPNGGPCAEHDCEQICLPYSATQYRYCMLQLLGFTERFSM